MIAERTLLRQAIEAGAYAVHKQLTADRSRAPAREPAGLKKSYQSKEMSDAVKGAVQRGYLILTDEAGNRAVLVDVRVWNHMAKALKATGAAAPLPAMQLPPVHITVNVPANGPINVHTSPLTVNLGDGEPIVVNIPRPGKTVATHLRDDGGGIAQTITEPLSDDDAERLTEQILSKREANDG